MTTTTIRSSDEIEYTIHGKELQCVSVSLDPGESVVAEAGAMMFMDTGIEMRTTLGDGSQPKGGFIGTLMGSAARKISGENFFMTLFTNNSDTKKHVGFATPHPGMVLPIDLPTYGGSILTQKESFLCAARGTKLSLGINKRIGAGMFGGEGFIMQKISGDGLAFVHAGGAVVSRELAAGDSVRVDSGCLVAMQASIDYDIEVIKGIGSMLFAGEGLFIAKLTGPGRIWIQSMPFGRTVDTIMQEVLEGIDRNKK